jgi:DHA2 family multidrug resistance protein
MAEDDRQMADDDRQMDVRKWIAVMGTILGAFMAVLDIQITNSSLADISGGIAATTDEGSWISTAYLIGEIITIPLTAYLSRVFTLRYYLLGNIVLFLTFSALAGLSRNLGEMIVCRVGQGFTGGVFIPTALTVIVTMLPKNLQGVGNAMFGLTATLAPAIGPYIGGLLTDRIGWQWNFYINFIPGALMFAAVFATIDRQPVRLNLLKQGDWIGIGSMAIGLGSLVAMLEEGQRKDWFGSPFIRNCGMLAAVFVPFFVLWEVFWTKHPVVNLRLVASRNLGYSTIVASVLGLGLYGTLYLIPLYLSTVQNYSPLLIGQVLVWVGLPQMLIFPFLPMLMKRFDSRLLVCFGSIFFAASCLMNSFMSYDYGQDQFIWANIVRAIGQPFTIVPVTGLALATLAPADAGDGSAIFNMFRNLGGSIGIALLSTVVTRREQFHDFRIGERVTAYDLPVQQRVAQGVAQFGDLGSGPVRAMRQALETIKSLVRREAFIMAFNDAFLIVAIGLIIGAIIVWFCKKPKPGAAKVAG